MEENPNTNLNNDLETIRTFQGDVQKVIKEGGGSLSKIAIAENNRRAQQGTSYNSEEIPESSGVSKLIIWTSVTLFVLGAGALVYFFVVANNKKNEVVPIINSNPIVTADFEKKLSLTGLNRAGLIQTIATEKDSAINSLSSIERILLTKNSGIGESEAAVSDFFQILNTKAPPEFIRSLDDGFALGLHSFKENQPFLVLKVNYYQNAFASMLSWEKDIEEDLGGIFIKPIVLPPASTTAETLARKNIFYDAVLQNFDTRALKRSDGTIILLYSFINKNTLVITTNPDTLAEVSRRILAGRLVQ